MDSKSHRFSEESKMTGTAGVEAIDLAAIVAVVQRKAHGMTVEATVTEIEARTEEIDAAAGAVVVVAEDVVGEISVADAMEVTDEIETAVAGEAETEAIAPEMTEAPVVSLLGTAPTIETAESLRHGAVIVINDLKAVHGEEATPVDEIEMAASHRGQRETLLAEANHHGPVEMQGAKEETAGMLQEHLEEMKAVLGVVVALQEVAELLVEIKHRAEIARQAVRGATLLHRVSQAAGDRRALELRAKALGAQRVQLQMQARGAQRVLLEQMPVVGEIKVQQETLAGGETSHKRKIDQTVGVMQAPQATGLQKEINQAGNFFIAPICHVQT